MSVYILLYFIAFIISIYLGYIVYKRYKHSSGIFFFLCTLFASLWCMAYFLSLSSFISKDIMIYISRFSFFSSTAGMYSFLLFINFFNEVKTYKITKRFLIITLNIFIGLFIITLFTPLIIKGISLDNADIYREKYGIFYFIYVLLYFMFLPISFYISKNQMKKLSILNKIRFRKILYFSVLFVGMGILFQIILPIFGIWLFEKELIIFFILFVLSIIYVIHRYFFLDLRDRIGKIIIGFLSIAGSVLILKLIHLLYKNVNTYISSYWYIQENYSSIDIIIGIILFVIIYKLLSYLFLPKEIKLELKSSIQKLQENISLITNFEKLNNYLSTEIQKIFKTNFCKISLFENKEAKNQIQTYFLNNPTQKYFINDVVFLEESKNKFDKDKILEEINKESFLIFPIFSKENKVIGIFSIGTKSFGDFYNLGEIEIIRKFVFFLSYHLKYLETYKQIEDLSLNLDKKVDEKTIEYNNLINKQKEFISMISHEIRSPISSAVFQADSIIDDLNNGSLTQEDLKNELEILNSLLIRIGDLSSKLFATQYYDTHSVALYKERIQISNLLKTELEIYSHLNENIKFIDEIDSKMGFIEIDKIQFQQVIGNIVSNAIKFINKNNGKILLKAYIKENNLHVEIEDNGKGFDGIEISNIFDKYSTGSGNSTGLGMGLYLCKRIIEMHYGEINAEISKKLGGAKFIIKIPIIH
ncbi:MAG: ATP-binding protein [Candidatus Gracilibacteria bacterium]|nr:ATP-binding protein [Candidatus Gracilibacteria bacterium]